MGPNSGIKMKIKFHLGSYKTGSSSIQNSLYNNKEILADNGVLYPETGLSVMDVRGRRHAPLVYDHIAGETGALPQGLLEEIQNSDANTTVFSAEAWTRILNLTHLTQIVSDLNENGYSDCMGYLALRNVDDYTLSFYREFTVNHKNSHPYDIYTQKRLAMFDYLLLTRAYHSIFGSKIFRRKLEVISFDGSSDIVKDLLSAMGLGQHHEKMLPVERANVKSLGALEIEAMRCANQLKVPKSKGLAALEKVLSKNGEFKKQKWTERLGTVVPDRSLHYRNELRKSIGWGKDETDLLLERREIDGRHVGEVSKLIIKEIKKDKA
jgi:hypothetical protein